MYAFSATAAENSILQISFSMIGRMNEMSFYCWERRLDGNCQLTGAAFGCGGGHPNKLYITTGGGSGQNVDVAGVETIVGAQLLEIQLD